VVRQHHVDEKGQHDAAYWRKLEIVQ